MLDNIKASYVLQEIKNIPLYEQILQEHKDKNEEIEMQKEALASPKSPQGHESLGVVVNQHNGNNNEARLLEYLEKQDELEYRDTFLKRRLMLARMYRKSLEQSENIDFINDYFDDSIKIRDLEKKHNVSNAFMKMRGLVKNFIYDLGI